MADFSRLPNFIILGAAKSGTTSLFEILKQHPQIFGTTKKEVGFFNNDTNFRKGLEWYSSRYFKSSVTYRIRMEATPAYFNWGNKTAVRIANTYQNNPIKFGLIFRDPVERAYSNYWHRVRLGQENLSFEKAIEAEDSRIADNYDELFRMGNSKYGYFRGGCYATNLKYFLEYFPIDSFIFLLSQDLNDDNFQQTCERILTFLKIDKTFPFHPVKENVSVASRNIILSKLYWKIKKSKWSKFVRTLPSLTNINIYNLLYKPTKYPPMDPEFADILRGRYKTEIEELEKLINRDLSPWLQVK